MDRLLLTLLFCLLGSVANAELIVEKNIAETVYNIDAVAQNDVEFRVFVGNPASGQPNVHMFEQFFDASDVGSTYVFDSGNDFTEAVALLTNGVDDFVTVFVDSIYQVVQESVFFSTAPDFSGRQITSIEATIDALDFNVVGSFLGNVITQIDFSGDLSVYAAVPEPSGFLLALCGLLAAASCHRAGRSAGRS